MIDILTSVSYPIYYLYKRKLRFRYLKRKRRGKGSLHPQPEGWGIRDPLHSLCNKLADDIAKHTDIKPLNIRNIRSGLKTSVVARPSTEAKMLANADRMDLPRFKDRQGRPLRVDPNKLFKLSDQTAKAKFAKTLDSLEFDVRSSRFVSDTSAELFPRRTSKVTGVKRNVETRGNVESVTRKEGYNPRTIENSGYKNVEYATKDSYYKPLRAQEVMVTRYNNYYTTSQTSHGYYAPVRSNGYYTTGKSSDYYSVRGSYRKGALGKYVPPEVKRSVKQGKYHTPNGNGYPTKSGYNPAGEYKPSEYAPRSKYINGGYTPRPSGYTTNVGSGYHSSGGNSGYGGSNGDGYPNGGVTKNNWIAYAKKRRGTDLITSKKQKKTQTYVKRDKDIAKIKRTIFNKLGGLESMFGGSSKPAKKRTTARKTTKRATRG